MSKTPAINLLKQKKKYFLDEFIKWALSVGRIIIILTELVALSAFLYRFSLDRKLIDLHDKIKQKQSIVELLKENELKYRKYQDKLSQSKQFSETSEIFPKILNDIYSFLPSDTSISNIIITPDNVKITATTHTVASLVNFVGALKKYEEVKSVSLDKIDNQVSTGILGIGITISLKGPMKESIENERL